MLLQTNILHMARFAPALQRDAIFSVGGGCSTSLHVRGWRGSLHACAGVHPLCPCQCSRSSAPPALHRPHGSQPSSLLCASSRFRFVLSDWPSPPTAPPPLPPPLEQDGTSGNHAGSLKPLGEEQLAVLDDRAHFERIAARLRGLPGRSAAESELKVGRPGRGAWEGARCFGACWRGLGSWQGPPGVLGRMLVLA